MKVAFTADLHLRSRQETPERFEALENILQKLSDENINELIIAGDTFDKESFNYHDFNSLCNSFHKIKITIIPGNHDPDIDKKYFPPDNIQVINKPTIKQYDTISVLFIPFDHAKLMDEVISVFFYQNSPPERWILIGHGDYCSTTKDINPYEPGIYMPLSGSAINKFNPLAAFLGHIHKAHNIGRIHYPGSPCPINADETGKRYFLVYNTRDNSVEKITLKSKLIFFRETLLILPSDNEKEMIEGSIDNMIKSWNLDYPDFSCIRLILGLKGFTTDLIKLKNYVMNYLNSKGITLYNNEPDLSKVNVLKDTDDEKITILKRVREKTEKLQTETNRDKILEKVQELIFDIRK